MSILKFVSDLFAADTVGTRTELAAQACVLHGFALAFKDALLAGIETITGELIETVTIDNAAEHLSHSA